MKKIEELTKNIFDQRKFLRLIEEDNLSHVNIWTLLNPVDANDLSSALSVSDSIVHFKYAVDDYDSSINSINQRNAIVSSGLKDNVRIKHLDLHKNFTGTPWSQAQPKDKPNYNLPAMIKINHSLVYLDLSNNGFADDYAKLIGEGLKGNKVIKHLNLSNNIITGAGIEKICLALEICAERIVYLDLSLNPLGDQGAIYLQPLLESTNSIQYLNLAQGQFAEHGNNTLFNSLLNNKSIVTLNYSNNSININSTKFLANMLIGNSTLKELLLEGNNIGVAGYQLLNESLRINKYITKLSLSQNNINGQAGPDILSDYLKTNNSVKTLNFRSNHFNNEGVKKVITSLVNNTSLICIDLSGANIGELGAMLLSKGLNSNKILLKKLDLSYNNLNSTGMVLLAKGIKDMNTLTHLNISNNNIGEQGGEAVFCALGKIKYLNVSSNYLTANLMKLIAESLKNDKSLVSLDISNNPIGSGTTSFLGALENNFTLTDLNMSGIGIGLNDPTICTYLKKNFSIASIKLNSLNLSLNNPQNTTKYLTDLIKSHPSIVSIELKGSTHLQSQNQLMTLIKECNTLVHFCINEPQNPLVGGGVIFINKLVANMLAFQKNMLDLNQNARSYMESQKDSFSFNLFILMKQLCAIGNKKFLPQELDSTDNAITPKVSDCLLNVSKIVKQLNESNVEDNYCKILSQMDLVGIAEYYEDMV